MALRIGSSVQLFCSFLRCQTGKSQNVSVENNIRWYPPPLSFITDLLGSKVVPFLLPDVGEGIETVQINEW